MPRPPAQNPNKKYVPAASAVAMAGVIATGLAIKGEGIRYKAYDDARPNYVLKVGEKVVGTLTVCVGHTDRAGGPPIVIGKVYTPAECDAYLQHDRRIAVGTVVRYAPELYVNAPTAAAAEDFVLNAGPSAFATSTMVKDFNAGQIESGCNRLFDWKYGHVKGVRVVINGLLGRRKSEFEQCVKDLSS